jgi:hypothetical protein
MNTFRLKTIGAIVLAVIVAGTLGLVRDLQRRGAGEECGLLGLENGG